MCGGSILSCCPRNPHGHERALKEEEKILFIYFIFVLKVRLKDLKFVFYQF